MLRVTAYEKMDTRIRMLADGRMKSHGLLLGPPGVGKTVSCKEFWPQSDEDTHRYEEIVDRIRRFEAKVEANLRKIAKLERFKASALRKSKGESSETSKEYESKIKGLERANRTFSNRIAALDKDLPPKGRRWIWTQGHQTARGLLDFLRKFADWDRIILNDAEINSDMAYLLVQLLEKTGKRMIDWKVTESKRVRFIIESDVVVISNAVTLGTRQKAILDAVISRLLAIQFTPTVVEIIHYLKSWMQNPFVMAQVERDHADGKVAYLDLRCIDRAAKMDDAGDREGCLEYLNQGYVPLNIDEIGDDERAILAYYQRYCTGQTVNIAEMSRQTERFRGPNGQKRRASAVNTLVEKRVLTHLAPPTGRNGGRPNWNVYLVNMEEARKLLGEPVCRPDRFEELTVADPVTEVGPDTFDEFTGSSESRADGPGNDPSPSASSDLVAPAIEPMGKPGPTGRTFAVLSLEGDEPLAFLIAEHEAAAETFRQENYTRPTRIMAWHENLPTSKNSFIRKLLIRDIRPKLSRRSPSR